MVETVGDGCCGWFMGIPYDRSNVSFIDNVAKEIIRGRKEEKFWFLSHGLVQYIKRLSDMIQRLDGNPTGYLLYMFFNNVETIVVLSSPGYKRYNYKMVSTI